MRNVRPWFHLVFTVVALLALWPPAVRADEGLWPYNQFPRQTLKEKHGFDVPAGFLDRLRLASVRIGGESGSFVSSNGLVVTDRQVAAGCLTDAAFLAPDRVSELHCPGLDASVLAGLDDVTQRVKTAGQSLPQRASAIERIEKECAAKSGNVCSVVTLFSGGRYDLYRYKRYSDVRLVFAPEYALAFFGKERDSISYLRYGLNVAFLRVYENGIPAATPDYLSWSSEGVREGELVFASGNPGPTARATTAAQLTFYRDTALPLAVSRSLDRIQQLNSLKDSQTAQSALTPLLNGFKREAGKLIGLRDDRLVTRKTFFEQKIRRAVETDSKLGTDAAKVWDEVASAYKKWTPFEKPWEILEAAPAPGSRLFQDARAMVRGEKLADSAAPINDQVEILMLTRYLEELRALGDKEAPLKTILAGGSARQAAEAMVQISHRTGAGDDGVMRLAKLLEPRAQHLRKQHEEIIGSLEVSAAEKIAQYRFQLFGASEYPDGTSTPRVEFGVVSGYTDRAGIAQPFAATFSGLYYRRNNEGPWQVPRNWIDIRPALNPVTPLDFVSTCDTGGGDFGGPVVNRAGELVGVTFDGNLESLPNVYLYTSDQARAVHVDVRGIAEALEKVYKANALLKELGIRLGGGVS
jgi:Peptidase S46